MSIFGKSMELNCPVNNKISQLTVTDIKQWGIVNLDESDMRKKKDTIWENISRNWLWMLILNIWVWFKYINNILRRFRILKF